MWYNGVSKISHITKESDNMTKQMIKDAYITTTLELNELHDNIFVEVDQIIERRIGMQMFLDNMGITEKEQLKWHKEIYQIS